MVVVSCAVTPIPAAPKTVPRGSGIRSVTVLHYEYKGGRFKKRYRQVKTFNTDGNLVYDRYYNPSGKRDLQWHYVYNRKKKCVRMTYRQRKPRRRLVRTYRYRYDKRGRVIEKFMHAPEMKTMFREVYFYDKSGGYRVREYRKYLPTGNEYPNGSRAYNSAGKLTRHCSVNSCSMNEYDRRGNIRRVRQQTRRRHHYLIYKNRYDAAGRLVEVTMGGSKRAFSYNKRGHKILEVQTMGGKPRGKKVYTYRP
jgi:YD repeat-containing protein